DRTHDPRIKSPLLYQLSYRPTQSLPAPTDLPPRQPPGRGSGQTHTRSTEERVMVTAAQHIVHTRALSGVRRVYGLAGDSLDGFTDALRATDGIDWISTRHEEAAAFAAGAEAGLTGQLTACAGSCGPGNTHLINGLYDAKRSRVPVLA